MGLPLQIEQRSVIKYLLAEKCKQCEIYRRMCNVYREACFSQNFFYKSAKHGFTTTSLNQKDSPWSGKNRLSGKEKVLGTEVSKENHTDRLLGHERKHRN